MTTEDPSDGMVFRPGGIRRPDGRWSGDDHNHDPAAACVPSCPGWAAVQRAKAEEITRRRMMATSADPDAPQVSVQVSMCRCRHPEDAHKHYRRGTNCSLCPCERFTAAGLGWVPATPLGWQGWRGKIEGHLRTHAATRKRLSLRIADALAAWEERGLG